MAQKLQPIGLVRLNLAFLSILGFVVLFTGSAEARSNKQMVAVSISEVAGVGQEFGSALSGSKSLTNTEKKMVRDTQASREDIKAWYDLVRVSRESVLVQIEF